MRLKCGRAARTRLHLARRHPHARPPAGFVSPAKRACVANVSSGGAFFAASKNFLFSQGTFKRGTPASLVRICRHGRSTEPQLI